VPWCARLASAKVSRSSLAAHDMGAPPALLWAADHPEEIAGLLYIEGPVMLSSVLSKIIAYTPEAMKEGSMWWWILPLAPDVPERLVVGHEHAVLTWFYDKAMANRDAITSADVDETLRTFAGREGVLGAMGVYRAAFTSIEQTEPLAGQTGHKVKIPVVALGGEKGLGDKVLMVVRLVAIDVEGGVIADCGHFLPESDPMRSSAISKRLVPRLPRYDFTYTRLHWGAAAIFSQLRNTR
jgi:pimeloyl-ACP methyl ester carboxylesterase